MPRDLFGEIVDPSVKLGTKQWYTVPLSILAHFAALFALVVVPLMATDMLPTPESVMAFVVTPPPPPPPPPPPAPVRVGGDIKAPNKIHDMRPVYPQVAMAAKVEGIVIIEATIGKDGHVTNAKVLRSQPLLDQAALDAVSQWQFTPTLLNKEPVEVIMTVTVNFTLH